MSSLPRKNFIFCFTEYALHLYIQFYLDKKKYTIFPGLSVKKIRVLHLYSKIFQPEHCKYWIQCSDWSSFEEEYKTDTQKFYDRKDWCVSWILHNIYLLCRYCWCRLIMMFFLLIVIKACRNRRRDVSTCQSSNPKYNVFQRIYNHSQTCI